MKYKIEFESRVRCIREIEADTDDIADQMAEKIADGLEIEDFVYDPAETWIKDIRITN